MIFTSNLTKLLNRPASEKSIIIHGDPCTILFRTRYSMPSLRWRHNERDIVSNHQPHGCLLNGLLRRRSKKTSKLRVTGLCVGNSPGPVNSPHKGSVTRKMFPFGDVIMMNRHAWWKQTWVAHFAIDCFFFDLALWCHQSLPVTSRERGVLLLWRHMPALFLHAQIGAELIFTSE